ncbi:MAG: hypothetical protein Q8M91_04880 [Polaromonas sp.]|nr:hypothetical protein [Polaromonas sp.]MDP3169653.1 hypothetical protein [Polaromonas sp.]MDP3605201.1 hypothetical protein [Polaromonas sp.]
MPNLSIKDVPEAWAQALRLQAARNHRSLQGELMAIVERAVAGGPAQPVETSSGERGHPRIVGYDKRGWPIVRVGWKTVAQVAADLKAKFPDGVSNQISSIDIIRQDRDSR